VDQFLGLGGLGPCNAGQTVYHSGTQNSLFEQELGWQQEVRRLLRAANPP